jgi:4-hydroxybenzoate polyprenyltransferase
MYLSIGLKDTLLNYFEFIFQEAIHGGYLTALGAPALVLTTIIITNSKINVPLLAISYLLPLIVYSFDYMRDLDKDNESNLERSNHLKKKKKYYPIVLLIYSILLLSLLLLYSNFQLILFIVSITIGGLLYATVLKGLTKKIPIFKNIYTVLTWSLGGTLFVSLFYSIPFSLSFLIVFIFINLKGIINAIFFDLKDYFTDSKEGLKTLPVLIGKKDALRLLHIINFVAFIPLILGVYLKIIPQISLTLIIFFFYSFYYLREAQNTKSQDIWVKLGSIADFEFIFWPILLIIGFTFVKII